MTYELMTSISGDEIVFDKVEDARYLDLMPDLITLDDHAKIDGNVLTPDVLSGKKIVSHTSCVKNRKKKEIFFDNFENKNAETEVSTQLVKITVFRQLGVVLVFF